MQTRKGIIINEYSHYFCTSFCYICKILEGFERRLLPNFNIQNSITKYNLFVEIFFVRVCTKNGKISTARIHPSKVTCM